MIKILLLPTILLFYTDRNRVSTSRAVRRVVVICTAKEKDTVFHALPAAPAYDTTTTAFLLACANSTAFHEATKIT